MAPATIANIMKGAPATHSDYVLAKRLAPFIGLWFVRPLFAHVIDPAIDPRDRFCLRNCALTER